MLRWIGNRFAELSAHTPGGTFGLVLLVVLLVAVLLALRLRSGSLRRSRRPGDDLTFGATGRTAADHRAAADAAAAAGAWADAVRERFRAVAATLTERGLLDAAGGLTATELARAGGAALPDCADLLGGSAARFADIWYGGRPATAADDALLAETDRAVSRARPGSTPAPRPPLAVLPG
ncbi:MAG TPA: DUF4129 domain-containing protein [Frankiaceae bacterium]